MKQPWAVLRPARESDHRAILRLAKSQMDPILMEAWGVPVRPEDLFGSDEVQLFVLETAERRMMGFYGLVPMDSVLHLQTLVLAPEYQGRGVGTAVMSEILQQAAATGCEAVELCVQTSNPGAIRLYKRLGFESQGMVFLNTLLMRKETAQKKAGA